MRAWSALTALGLAVSLFGFVGCGGDDDPKPGSGGAGGTGGSSGSGGNNFSGPCWPKDPSCSIAGPGGPGYECLAKHDNSASDVWQGRLTKIEVKKPAALATQLVQGQIIDKGVNLNAEVCNETGQGTFAWLFEFDSTNNKLKTGGGLPVTDALAGSCFVQLAPPQVPLAVGPITVDVNVMSDGNFSAEGIDVNVPVFAVPGDLTKVILLPLHQVAFSGKWSDDHNCVGKYNGDDLTPADACLGDSNLSPPTTPWTPGGTIAGFITMEEADQVFVDDLGQSLCVTLQGTMSSAWKGPDGFCKTSAMFTSSGGLPKGDWCSTSNMAGECQDAVRLEANFAAAAFKINGDCP